MTPIQLIVQAGGLRALSTLAAEAAGTVAAARRSSKRSLASLAIASVRRSFPGLTQGTSGYEVARNVWRRAVRLAAATARERASGPVGTGGGPRGGTDGPLPIARERDGTYVYRVRFDSPGGTERWRTVTLRGPAGLSDAALASQARASLSDGPDQSPGQGSRRTRVGPRSVATEVVVLTFIPD